MVRLHVFGIFGISIFCLGMAMFFAISAFSSPQVGLVAVPVSLAFSAIGMLAGALGGALKSYGDRLQRLEEQQLEKTNIPSF